MFVGFVLCVMAWAMRGQVGIPEPFAVGIVGGAAGLFTAIGVALMIQRVRVRFTPEQVSVRYGPLPWPPSVYVRRSEVIGFVIVRRELTDEGTKIRDVWDVNAQLIGGTHLAVAVGMHSAQEADRLKIDLEYGLTGGMPLR